MASRLDLQTELETILGSSEVYFQPPASVKLSYPCIIYSRSSINKQNANDQLYKSINEYEVTVIDPDPENTFADDILAHFPMCRFDRQFVSENLNHTNLRLYY